MSGIEVAGIALAILPLIVNQLDSYVQGLETLGDLRTKRYRSKLDHYATNLGSQQASFINTLERSLEGVVEFDDGIDSLEPHEIKALWEKATVQRLLKKKLGRNYLPFMQTMKELSTLLEEIHRKLGWDKMPVEVFWKDSSSFNREVKKFKDTFSKSIYERIFSEIKSANEQLANLTEQSEHRSQVQKRKISKRSLPQLKRSRKLAQSLHNAILNDKCWKCTCRDRHTIHFLLGSQSPIEDNIEIEPLSARFRMVFASPSAHDISGTLGKAHEIEAKSDYLQPTPQAVNIEAVAVQSIRAHNSSVQRKTKVSFSMQDTFTTLLSEEKPPSPPIYSICLTLSTMAAKKSGIEEKNLLGCVMDGTQQHLMYHLRKLPASPKLQSLAELLETSSSFLQAQMNGAVFFSQKDRLTLAANLACSVLQFHGNWLQSRWRARDIIFIREPTGNIGHPTLALNAPHPVKDSTMCRGAANSALIRNEILFPLGLVLVELSLCQPLEQLRTAEDHDENEATSNLKTATRLLRYVELSSGPLYGDVVEQCLSWRWKGGYTLDDEAMQEEIYQRIVFPLAENLKNFVKGSQLM